MKIALFTCVAAMALSFRGYAQETPTLAANDAPATVSTPPSLNWRPDPETGAAHERMYRWSNKVDLPISIVGTAWSLYAFGKIYSKDTSTLAEIQALRKEDLNGFDRWAAGKNSDKASDVSDIFFYGSMPLPVVLMLDPRIRKDAGRVGLMYWEAFAITGLLYTGSTFFVDRYRPETYNEVLPDREKVDGNYKNSFFAGHVAVVATSTFFCAKVFSDYHPGSPWRWAAWGGAAAATGATIYLRHEAGKHFPSDLVIGTAVGVLSGVLVPHLHKNRNAAKSWGLSPALNYRNQGMGLSFNYRF